MDLARLSSTFITLGWLLCLWMPSSALIMAYSNPMEEVKKHRKHYRFGTLHCYLRLYRYFQSQMRNSTGSRVEWAESSLIIETGYWVQVFLLHPWWISRFVSGHSVCWRFDSQDPGSNPAFSGEKNLPPFDSKIAWLCQIIEVKNKHVYLQSQVQKPTSSGVEWAECSLMMGTSY